MFGFGKPKAGRILVVEDDWDILEVLKLMLEYEGHEVTTAKHGRAALAAAAAKPFDLVVMDISMPEMSGIEVARELRSAAKTADVYIVVHTGLDESWVRERFDDYDVFLTKAEDADILVQEIARLLALKRAPSGERQKREEEVFDFDDVVKAQRALRREMSMGAETYPMRTLLGMVRGEVEQLRRLGRSDAEIAQVLSTALGRPIPVPMLPSRIDEGR